MATALLGDQTRSKAEAATAILSDVMTRAQAAAYLGVKPQTLAVWATKQRHDLPFTKSGRFVRYLRADLDRFLEDHKTTTSATS